MMPPPRASKAVEMCPDVARLLQIGVLAALLGCAHTEMQRSRDESWRLAPTRVGAELQFFAPYVRRLASECGDRFELTLRGRSPLVILTQPGTYESSWELKTCKNAMNAVLDCRGREEIACESHEWPLANEPDALLGHELEAVARHAPDCAEDAFTLERTKTTVSSGSEPWQTVSDYRVTRCGASRELRVGCTMHSPYRCEALE